MKIEDAFAQKTPAQLKTCEGSNLSRAIKDLCVTNFLDMRSLLTQSLPFIKSYSDFIFTGDSFVLSNEQMEAAKLIKQIEEFLLKTSEIKEKL